MLRVFVPNQPAPLTSLDAMAGGLPAGVVWIDMLDPTKAEEAFVGSSMSIHTTPAGKPPAMASRLVNGAG